MLPDIGYASVPLATTPGTAATEAEGRRLWEQVMRRLEGVLHPDALQRWFTDARVTSIEHDRVTVTVPGADVALKLASYRGLISRRMSETLGRTVDVVFQATHLSGGPRPHPPRLTLGPTVHPGILITACDGDAIPLVMARFADGIRRIADDPGRVRAVEPRRKRQPYQTRRVPTKAEPPIGARPKEALAADRATAIGVRPG